MKLNRKWILVIALLMSVAVATAGTLAYLTDRDSEANVFTIGNVEIDLNEDFDQGAALIPGVDIEKKPTITNTGKTEAWAWMIVSVPTALDNWNQGGGQEGSNNNVIHWNITGATHEGYVTQDRVDKAIEAGILPKGTTAADILANNQTWDVLNNGLEYQNAIDGVMYNHYVMLYNKALEPGETTLPIMHKVFLDAHVDIDPEGNMSKVDAGVVTPIDWNVNEDQDGNPIIYVSAYAIQAEGFESVEAAYAAYNAQWGDKGAEFGTPATLVDSADALIEALENDEAVNLTKTIVINPASMSNAYGKTGINIKNGQTLNGNGYTIDIQGAGGTWDSGINTTGGLIKNVTVTGSFRGIFINHNSTHSERVVLDNVTIEGTTYTISCDQGTNQGLTATDSTFNGWTSYAATLGDAEFIGCNFGEGNGYAYFRPYAPTTFTNCNFEAGYQMDARAAVTFENCYLGGVLITAENVGNLVTSNTSNATVK